MNNFFILFIISFLSFAGISKADGHKPDIVETAVAAGSFNTLVKAVTAAELVQTLKGKGPFTVFAPSDEAFSALDSDILSDLLKPENKSKLPRRPSYGLDVVCKSVCKSGRRPHCAPPHPAGVWRGASPVPCAGVARSW